MIFNARNRSNNATESQREKNTCFNAQFQYKQSVKNHGTSMRVELVC